VRDGVLVLGLAPTEVAAVGLVALAGADAVFALAAVTGSLVVSAVAGPLLLSVLGGAGDVRPGPLVGSFALVVLLPLAVGLAARAAIPALGRAEPHYAAGSTVVIAALAYAALSGASSTGSLGEAWLAASAFLAVSATVAAVAARVTRDLVPAFCLGLRDFAVAAALATQAFGPSAGTVAGVYGVMMLVAGAGLAAAARRGGSRRAAPDENPPPRCEPPVRVRP
jgi:predicted Na+-dependent transporter